MEDYQIKKIDGDVAIVRFKGRDFNVSLETATNWVETMKKTSFLDYAEQIRRFKKIVHAIENHIPDQ